MSILALPEPPGIYQILKGVLLRMQYAKLPLVPSRAEAILTVLRPDILAGRRKPGERLNLDDLAASFGVSRMPVRDALKQLEAEGLVRIYANRGIEVSSLDASDIRELFGIRIILEQQAIGLAIPNLGRSQLRKMKAMLERMDGLSGRNSDWIDANTQFHEVINQASKWPRLLAMIHTLRANVERYVRLYIRMLGTELPQAQHWAIYEACASQDVEAARSVMAQHLSTTATELLHALQDTDGAQRPSQTVSGAIKRRLPTK